MSKLTVLFKKGDSSLCDNYRGISVINSLAKVYNSILSKRLELWFKLFREQAGAQKGRSCEEQITTLRLAIDTARHRKEKLFIAYVDYSKAYDNIPRSKLLSILKQLGCGYRMLRAIAKTYCSTKSALGSTIIEVCLGLKQGSPTSCILFIIYLNELIKLYHSRCSDDGFLGWLHCILLMDDAAVLSTNREQCEEKLRIMNEFCVRFGMKMNFSKTMFMVINGSEKDRETLRIDGKEILHCKKYVYLGAIILENPSFNSFIEHHRAEKNKNTLKLCSFLNKNPDLPFVIKKKVMEACIFSSLLYGSESWFNDKVGKLNSSYLAAVKMVLGVKSSCSNEMVLLESGYPSLLSLIKEKQFKFFRKLISSRSHMSDDPFMHMLRVARLSDTPAARYIDNVLGSTTASFTSQSIEEMKAQIRCKAGSKFIMYRELNPDLSKHPLYYCNDIIESHRIAFSRFRVGSHRLRIETGRWSRLPRESRTCSCDERSIQDEVHIIVNCSLLEELRSSFPTISFSMEGFFKCDYTAIAAYIYQAMKIMEN